VGAGRRETTHGWGTWDLPTGNAGAAGEAGGGGGHSDTSERAPSPGQQKEKVGTFVIPEVTARMLNSGQTLC
jgi:hypothetical protein